MKVEALSPRMHGVILHQAVRVLARNAALDQVEQQLSAEDEATRALEIRQHAFGINEQSLDQVRRLVQQVAGEPFCFSLKYSSASRTSVRCKWRISVVILSRVEAIVASVAR